jgi:hypothetical protein
MVPIYTFDPQFKRINNNKSYVFKTNSVVFQEDSVCCDGVKVDGSNKVSDEEIWALPESCRNEELVEHILTAWYQDCKKAFIKPLNVTSLLKKVEHVVDKDYPIAALKPDEDEEEWILQWSVVRVELSATSLILYWAPTDKKLAQSRIAVEFEIQGPEESQYRIIENSNSQLVEDASWVQDITQLPLSDRPALRLETEMNSAREKFRKRVRDARLRAKLAKYRAERLCQLYLERYGDYPIEDNEEAQTEYENSSGDESG